MPVAGWTLDLVDLAAALAADARDEESAAFDRLQAAGRTAEVEELLLQSYLFLGFPAALEAFRRWRARGVEPPSASTDDLRVYLDRGQAVCSTVYGSKYENLRRAVVRLHPDLDRWMVVEGYGKVLGRPGLDLDVRELCIVAMLVVVGPRARRQLRSHLMGAVNAGADPGDVERAVRRAARLAPPEHLELARKLQAAVLDRGAG